MHHLTSQLLLYTDTARATILEDLSFAMSHFDEDNFDVEYARIGVNAAVKEILNLSTAYGFSRNLWQAYLTYHLVTCENSFSLTCERVGATEGGSVNHFAKADFAVFKRLFDFDFSAIEADLGIDCFSVLTHYTAIPK